ncbi:transglutaminase domain-containing protein [Arcanobacterium phocae]|uniref:transglutaminase domain-containing protein n=1 Tax=Arcanobacterium phocae TaxID=131112 RepID=UPI001C0F2C19|nr:transglutaminase domain-containing protein [Arcanobacterium phocae]
MKNRKRLLSTALGLCFVTSSLQLGIIDVFGTGPSAHAAVIQDAGQHWDASQDLKDYLSRPIDWTHPTLAPKGKIDVNTAQEYLVKAISEMQSTVVFYGDYDLSDKAIAPLIYKHPNGSLIRHIAGDWKVDKEEVSFEKGLYKHTVRFAYLVSKEDAIRADRRIDEIVRFLTKKLNRLKDVPGTRNSNEYRKARLIHDYIIKNVKPIADEQTATGHYYVKSAAGDGKQYEIHSLEAGLFANQGVCQTYTIMFDRIASRMGLQTRYVRGKKSFGYFTNDSEKERLLQQVKADERIAAKGGRWPEANHSWNQVKIDGHWYHLDLTVDAVSSRSMYKYTYAGFLRTDEEFGEPTTWWIGEHHKKNYSAFANVTWNQSEAEPATKPMNFGKLFSSYSSSRPLQSNLSGSRHPLGNFSDDEVGVLPLKQYSAETSSVSQIVSPYGEKEVAEVPAGISAEDLPKTLKLQGITSAIPTESYKLGTFEDSPVSLAKPDDWEKQRTALAHISASIL